MNEKPHHGRIKNWTKDPCEGRGLGYRIFGEFLDHPHIRGDGRTSAVTSHNSTTGEIETRNSRYRLVKDGEPTRMPGFPWKGDRMRFLGQNGYDHQLAKALGIFKVGQEYTVAECRVGEWNHSIKFVGVHGWHNGVMFETVR